LSADELALAFPASREIGLRRPVACSGLFGVTGRPEPAGML
jgi:hypothetical protein